jgi:hypothetical protein
MTHIFKQLRPLGANRRYKLLLTAILLVAVGLLIYAKTRGSHESLPETLAYAVAEALLVAFLLALIVDPKVKETMFREFSEKTAPNLVWALTNPSAPEGYRDLIRELADQRVLSNQLRWSLRFEWVNDEHQILELSIESFSQGQNLHRGEHRPPATRPWVLNSVEGFQSSFTAWLLSIPGAGDFTETRGAEALGQYIVPDSNHRQRLILDEQKLFESFGEPPVVPAGGNFTTQKATRQYRESEGWVPLTTKNPVLHLRFELSGSALPDLDFNLYHLGVQAELEDLPDGRLGFTSPGAVPPGGVTMLSWSERPSSK